MLPAVELYKALNKAQQQKLFDELQLAYDKLPKSTCKNCARCCSIGSPPAFFIEYINMYRYVRDHLKDRWQDFLSKSAEYFYLELVDVNQKCPFLGDDKRCDIYEVRPATCRFFGLLSKQEFEKGNLNQGLQYVAKKLWEDHQIKIPDEIANSKIEYCGDVSNSTGKPVPKKELGIIIGELAKLDAYFFPEQLVDQEGTMLPYPVHLMNTVLGDGARARKLKIMKEYADHQSRELLDPIVARAAKYEF